MATKKCYSIFTGLLYKRTDGVTTGSPLLDIPFLTHFFHTMKKTGYIVVRKDSNDFFLPTLCPQSFIFFWSNDHLKYFQEFLSFFHTNTFFLWRQKDKTNFPFSMLKLLALKINLQPQLIVNVLLVMYVVILRIFYLPFSTWYVYIRDFRCFLFDWIGQNSLKIFIWRENLLKIATLKTLFKSVLRSF